MAHGVDQSGEVDEMGDGLGCPASSRTYSLWDEFCRPVVQHSGATDCVKGDREDGVVQCEGPVAGCQVAHGDRLQAGKLGRGVAGDGRDCDVGQSH